MKKSVILLTACVASVAALSAADPAAKGDGSIVVPSGSTDVVATYETAAGKPETKAEHDARMAWWREARYGLFIHWSLSSVYAGEWKGKPSGGDWIMERVKAPVAEYAEGAKRFTAENFNADEWVALAKAGGMKYIVITAKHHDGFTMFPSKASKFNIRDATSFKRDPMAELAAACRREGIKFGIYYSQAQDWHHAGGYKPTIKWGPNEIGCEPGESWDPAQDGDPDAYVKNIAAVHVQEMVENYHPDILWWDYPTQMPEESVKMLRAPLAGVPNVIVNNRLGNGVKGDFATFEFDIPEEKTIGRDWETCTNMNKSWGYRRLDLDYRPTSDLLREFIEIISRGGNYLLNIGPDSTGTIPEPQIERITQIGKWMKQNADFVYGTEAVKIGWQPKNQWLVSKDGVYYLHVTGWGKQAARLPGLSTGIVSATTTTGESLAVEKDGEGITTIAPPANPDPLGTVVILKLAGPVETKPARAECSPRPDGTLLLRAKDAELAEKMRLGSAGGQPVFRNWVDPSQIPGWKLMVPPEAAGEYRVTLVYSCEEAEAGSTFELATGESKVAGTVESTGDVQTVKRFDLPGLLRLEPGPQTLSIAPLKIAKNSVVNLRDITLTPVKPDPGPPPVPSASEPTKEQRDAKMAWFRDAKFGMFIHWGVYAVPAGVYKGEEIKTGTGEWIMNYARIPVAEYRAFGKSFNPVKYDPAAWAALAKDAGMKYLVITAKHHDGFALFDSKASDWNVVKATAYGKDLIAPLKEAVRAEGLKFGIYYSHDLDWSHPGGGGYMMEQLENGKFVKAGEKWDKAQEGSFDDYLRNISLPQVCELLTAHTPDIIWWDYNQNVTPERAAPFVEMIKARPALISNNRLGGGFKGDLGTPEQHLPGKAPKESDWEFCMTMNETWGFKSYDHEWKSSDQLIRKLVEVVCRGGNFLLNVGPTAEGTIPPESVERLKAVGAWLRVNGEAIYGTRSGPFQHSSWGGSCRKGNKIFLHVCKWPEGRLSFDPLPDKVLSARTLTGAPVTIAQTATELSVSVAEADRTTPVTVIELTLDRAVTEAASVASNLLVRDNRKGAGKQ